MKVIMQHCVIEFYINDDPGLTLNVFKARSNLVPYGKCIAMDFSEASVFHYINVGKFSQLNEYMNLYECQRSGSFIDLGPNHSDSIFLNFFSSITSDFNIS